MIHTENLIKTTRLTVCNYDLYQIDLHDEQTQPERQPNAEQTQAGTNNNDNNENNNSPESEDSVLSAGQEKNQKIPYQEIIGMWNNILCPTLSKVTRLTDSRKKKIKLRFTEMGGLETLKQLFEKIKSSKFLLGDGSKGWKTTFDWVIENDRNWVKIMEGNYNGSTINGKSQQELSTTPKIPEIK
jgi:hypothetical protein